MPGGGPEAVEFPFKGLWEGTNYCLGFLITEVAGFRVERFTCFNMFYGCFGLARARVQTWLYK